MPYLIGIFSMAAILHPLWPEILLTAVACVLFVLGASKSASSRQSVPMLALLSLVAVIVGLLFFSDDASSELKFGEYIKLLSAGVAILFVLLSWPTNAAATGNA